LFGENHIYIWARGWDSMFRQHFFTTHFFFFFCWTVTLNTVLTCYNLFHELYILDSLVTIRIGGVMARVLASSVVHRGFEPQSCKTKDCKIGTCCFSAKHTALRRKSKDWLARNQNNVSAWSDMSTLGLLFKWASTIQNPTQRVGLVQSGPYHHLIENELVLAMI
jgi:hypothetical protein